MYIVYLDGDEDDVTVSGMAALAEAYFQKLPTCVNRDFIDQVINDFLVWWLVINK